LFDFLHAVSRLVAEWDEGLVPVLRGSLLLHHWYGRKARPPADLDIECFDRPDIEREYDTDEEPDFGDDEFYGPAEGRFGQWGNFVSRIDLGKAMCRYAAGSARYERPGGDIGIRFGGVEAPPADGSSLWVYGTPGKRYYTAWEWPGHRPASGRLQLDLATPGPYTPDEIGVAEEAFLAPGEVDFRARAYSKEAMLAAKLSWVIRSFVRAGGGRVAWVGEPKDLFDAHLIVSDEGLRPDVFRRAMLAIGAADGLNWNALDVLFDVRRMGSADGDFVGWDRFTEKYPGLAPAEPPVLWAELVGRLEPLLGDLYSAEEMPFLVAANTPPEDRLVLLVYADWLEERGDPRAQVLRLIARAQAAEGVRTDEAARRELAEALDGTSKAWLFQLFGTAARLQAFRDAAGCGQTSRVSG
jgi:uncharacterized protein (TIGR02996 family)